jgi:hypothetical protein
MDMDPGIPHSGSDCLIFFYAESPEFIDGDLMTNK